MTVVGFVGLPGSGKSEAAAVAAEEGIPVVAMGDVVRQACRDRGLDPAEHHGRMARRLREENGPAAVAEATLPHLREHLAEADTVVVEGIRSDVEVDAFEEAFGEDFLLVSVEAPFEVRQRRLAERGRDDLDGESLADRDERELGFGMGAAMERADVAVENTDTLASFRERIRRVLTEGPEAVR